MANSTPSLVVGTAGHVDHGKSSLVKALTGTDPDRLAEEQRRQMTIVLGFAHLTLVGGGISFVDVPGHERFIATMLAGADGIDAAMLVVAADDGPMPQTREHLAILDQLGIDLGLVVISKADLVEREWLSLVTTDVAELIAPTTLRDAPIVAVSSRTGAGLAELRRHLATLATRRRPRRQSGGARLPIDRVFTLAGHGTVVTGTLRDGPLAVGDTVQLYPGERQAKIRGLQTHGAQVPQATPGSRVAVNLAGVDVAAATHGDVLAPPGSLTASHRLDALVTMLPGSSVALTPNQPVRLFLGAQEVAATAVLLDRDEVPPGESAFVQLRCREAVVARHGDRGILRRPSPSETIAGARVLDPVPPRHRRFQPATLQRLRALATGSPADLILTDLTGRRYRRQRDLLAAPPAGLDAADAETALANLVADGQVIALADGPSATSAWLLPMADFAGLRHRLLAALDDVHAREPLQAGLPRAIARRVLDADAAVADSIIAALASAGDLVDERTTLRRPEFTVRFPPARAAVIAAWERALAAAPVAPPAAATFGILDVEVVALHQLGRVRRLSADLAFAPGALDAIVNAILDLIETEGQATVATTRDRLGTSRRFAQAILEWLDAQRVTRRVGDIHVRGPAAATGDERVSR